MKNDHDTKDIGKLVNSGIVKKGATEKVDANFSMNIRETIKQRSKYRLSPCEALGQLLSSGIVCAGA